MQISSNQCRAARGLLNWTQEELAKNATVSRATIVDFEANARQPIKNNLSSIRDSMYAAGVEFIPEQGDLGVGVRFRKKKLEYTNSVNIDRFERLATMRMRYAGQKFDCVVDLNAVDDFHADSFKTDEDYGRAFTAMLPHVLRAAEFHAVDKIENGRLLVTYAMIADS